MRNFNQSDLFTKSILRNRVRLDRKRYSKKSINVLKELQSLINDKIASKHYYYINFFQLHIINSILKTK